MPSRKTFVLIAFILVFFAKHQYNGVTRANSGMVSRAPNLMAIGNNSFPPVAELLQ